MKFKWAAPGRQTKQSRKERRDRDRERGKQRGKRGKCKKLQGRNERKHLSRALQKTTRNVAQNYSAHCLAAKQTKANWRWCWGGKAQQAKETEKEEGISRCIALMLAAFGIEFAYTWLPPNVAQSAGLLSRRGGWAANRIRNRNETHKQTFLCLAEGREEQQGGCGKRVQYLVAYTQRIATILELRANKMNVCPFSILPQTNGFQGDVRLEVGATLVVCHMWIISCAIYIILKVKFARIIRSMNAE